jgi:hypothetical protein
VHTL